MKMSRRLSFAAATAACLLSGSAVHAQQPAQPAAVGKDAEATMAAVSVSAGSPRSTPRTASSSSTGRRATSSRCWCAGLAATSPRSS